MDIGQRIDNFLDNKWGSQNSPLSPENKELLSMRLNQDYSKDPKRVGKFLDTMERERVSLGASAADAGRMSSELAGNNTNPNFINRSTLFVDPRMVGQDNYDLIGNVVKNLSNNRTQELTRDKRRDPTDDFATKQENEQLKQFHAKKIEGQENRLGTLKQDFPEAFGAEPAQAAPSLSAPAYKR